MKYMLASDYDGTLCRNGIISGETITAIKEFRARGNLFGVVTGRDYINSYEYFTKNNSFPFDFIIANNGASAYDKDGNTVFIEQIDGSVACGTSTLAQAIIEECLQLTSFPCGIAFEKTRYDFHPDYPSGTTEEITDYSPYSVLADVKKFVLVNARCDTAEQAANVAGILKEKFGFVLNPTPNGSCIDIITASTDKSTGIARLAKALGIPCECIWTAGDNFNDMTMLEKYHGCAISSGVKDIRNVSEYICESIADVIKIITEK